MRPYEIVVIFDSAQDDSANKAVIEKVTDTLKASGSEIGTVDYWGRRRLAYPINHKTEGFYALVQLMAEPAPIAEASRTLQLTDGVIRHKVIRIPEETYGKATSPEGARDSSPKESRESKESVAKGASA